MPGTPGPRTGLPPINPTGEAPTILRSTINAVISWLEGNAMLTSSGLLSARPVSTPGSPGISGRRYYATDTGVEYRDTGTGWIALGVELVTALPASPYNGQIIDLLIDATNGVAARLRYRAASASPYKWEAVGTGDLYSEILNAESFSNDGYSDLATVGPSITVPVAGDYLVTIGAHGRNDNADGGAAMSFAVGATAATDSDRVMMENGGAGANAWRSLAGPPRRKTGLTAGTVIRAKYRRLDNIGGAYFEGRRMTVRPIRVG